MGRHRGARTRMIASAIATLLLASCDRGAGGPATPTSSRTPAPTETSSPSPSRSPRPTTDEIVVVAVGDIVCEPTSPAFHGQDPIQCQHRATARLVRGADAVLALGDLQYEEGGLAAYRTAYDRSWGRFADITYPAPGNHEYATGGAAGYVQYWRSKHRPIGGGGRSYSFDLGSWHLISLDSNCITCGQKSAQDRFLERDLARTEQECILAYWHHPYFNSGEVHGEERPALGFWEDLYAAGADLVLNGNEHNYQRYAQQTPSGRATAHGIREFIVGTGGRSLYGLLEDKDPNYETGDAGHFGVLRL